MKKLLLVLLALLIGCGIKGPENNMPETMPDDFAFKVQYGYYRNDEVNTFNGTVTKDLIEDGKATTEIIFTQEELKDIYSKMREINITSPKELEPKIIDCQHEPHYDFGLKVQINEEITEYTWSGQYCEPSKDAGEIEDLIAYIHSLVKEKPEYKKLPEPTGGYD